jgi:DNA-binding NarL/FixJ family response regulator
MIQIKQTAMIKILLVDDHKIFCDGLVEIFRKINDFKVLGCLYESNKVMFFLKETLIDLIIMDIDLPGDDGLTLAENIRGTYPDIKIMLLTMHNEAKYFEEAYNNKINGYVLKSVEKLELIYAIKSIASGKMYNSQEILNNYLKYCQQATKEKKEEIRITPREKEVLQLIIKGKTTDEICEILFISKHTVDSHRKHLLCKLGVKNTVELVMYAIEKKLVSNVFDN